MLLIIGALGVVGVIAALVILLRVRGGADAGQLGWMSEQWLAEHRATHPSLAP
jgi:hypothetical protein